MLFNDPAEFKARVKRMSTPVLKKEHNKRVQRMALEGTSCVLSVGSALFSKGTKAAKLVALFIAAGSAYSGFNNFDEYEIICDELAERGVEVHRRTRDMVAPAGLVVATDLAAKSLDLI